MNQEHTLILNLIFILLGGFFSLLEVLFPERSINYKKEFHLDFLAFLLLSFCGIFISNPLINYYRSLHLGESLFFLQNLNPVVKVFLATLLTDFLNYGIHYFMHSNQYFWKTHIHHHRIKELYWFSGLRASFGHYLAFIFSRITVGVLLFNLNSLELLYYLTFGLITNFFQHTNARISSKWIEYILVTPRLHRRHHSIDGKRLKNIATIFSFWDRLFNTFEGPENFTKDYPFGVKTDKKTFFSEFIGF